MAANNDTINEAATTVPLPSSKKVREKFSAFCTPMQDDFNSLIDMCNYADSTLPNDSEDANSATGLKLNDQLLGLNIVDKGGLIFIPDVNSHKLLSLQVGKGFKLDDALNVNTDKSLLSDSSSSLSLKTNANSGISIKSDAIAFILTGPLTLSTTEAAPNNSQQALFIKAGLGLVENSSELTIKLAEHSGLDLSNGTLSLNLGQGLTVTKGKLTVDLDGI